MSDCSPTCNLCDWLKLQCADEAWYALIFLVPVPQLHHASLSTSFRREVCPEPGRTNPSHKRTAAPYRLTRVCGRSHRRIAPPVHQVFRVVTWYCCLMFKAGTCCPRSTIRGSLIPPFPRTPTSPQPHTMRSPILTQPQSRWLGSRYGPLVENHSHDFHRSASLQRTIPLSLDMVDALSAVVL